MSRRMSAEGLSLLKESEGLRLSAYQDSAGVWTIGWGHTTTAYPGQLITRDQAEALLREDIRRFERAVNAAVQVPLSQLQFDALVSFAFNVGAGAFRSSTLLARLNAGDYDGVPEELQRWIYAGGHVVPGLKNRRDAEIALWLRGTPSPSPAPPAAPGEPPLKKQRTTPGGPSDTAPEERAAPGWFAAIITFITGLWGRN